MAKTSIEATEIRLDGLALTAMPSWWKTKGFSRFENTPRSEDGSLSHEKLLARGEQQLDDIDLASEAGEATSPRGTREATRRWKAAAVVSTVALVVVSLSWVAREIQARDPTPWNFNTVSATTGNPIEFPVSNYPHVFSPADVAAEWKAAVFHSDLVEPDRTPWQGPPTDEVDASWAKLWKNKGVVKISKADAERLPNVTLPIPGEADEYIVGIEVYHQLHCLDKVRMGLYPDRYGGDRGMNHDEKAFYWIHLEHCLDYIRQVLTCYGDVTTIPWKYNERRQFPYLDFHTTHVCRNFEKLTDWATDPARDFPRDRFTARMDCIKAGGSIEECVEATRDIMGEE